ncbi:hypothetical protein Ddc_09912 [Ditylenchus destructor]|nr:hypothetical protein Ddc_09912 [Ditylenchus destructor]
MLFILLSHHRSTMAQCPMGMEADGYCGSPKFICFGPKEQCISSTCCQPSKQGTPMMGPGGQTMQGQPSQQQSGTGGYGSVPGSNGKCPIGMEEDGYCGFPKFLCLDPKEQCVNSACCEFFVLQTIIPTKMNSGQPSKQGTPMMGPGGQTMQGQPSQQSGTGGYGSMPGSGFNSNGNCPVGMEEDGYCGFPKFFCLDPKEQCISSTCCQPSKQGIPTMEPGGQTMQGSPFCPSGQVPDGYCGFPKFLCIDPKEICFGSTCCQPSQQSGMDVMPGGYPGNGMPVYGTMPFSSYGGGQPYPSFG